MVQAVSFAPVPTIPRPSGIHAARVTLRDVLPPKFNGLISAYPQAIFRPRLLETTPIDGVLMFVDGQAVRLDGKSYRLSDSDTRSLTIGSFVAVHVVNERDEPTPVEIVVRGVAVDIGGEVASRARLGRVLMPIDEPSVPEEPAPAVDTAADVDDAAGEPESIGVDNFGRVALGAALGSLAANHLVPMLLDIFMPPPEPPPAPAEPAGASEEICVTELAGVGAVEPPPGDGWCVEQTFIAPSGATRAVWRRWCDRTTAGHCEA